MKNQPALYTKSGCPWCAEAREVLDRRGLGYTEQGVTTDAAAFAERQRPSGRIRTPVLTWGGEVLADFGAVELEAFLVGRVTDTLPAEVTG